MQNKCYIILSHKPIFYLLIIFIDNCKQTSIIYMSYNQMNWRNTGFNRGKWLFLLQDFWATFIHFCAVWHPQKGWEEATLPKHIWPLSSLSAQHLTGDFCTVCLKNQKSTFVLHVGGRRENRLLWRKKGMLYWAVTKAIILFWSSQVLFSWFMVFMLKLWLCNGLWGILYALS